MAYKETRISGNEALSMATQLLQRANRAHPEKGIWEAADVQWWWRTPRRSDEMAKIFWMDDEGPVAGILVTSWSEALWQCDPIVVSDMTDVDATEVWQRALDQMVKIAPSAWDVPIREDDLVFQDLARNSGFTASGQDTTAWLCGTDQPAVLDPADGFRIVDRRQRHDRSHPMIPRNGRTVSERLAQCSLYDPGLDLSIETEAGIVAGYSLYWFDPVTRTGLVEPVRVEDEFQRLGLARAMLSVGIDRLVKKGAKRIKVSHETEAAGRLYEAVGFKYGHITGWYRAPAR